ncbi:hypothetical protein [Novosphingobium sp.]|uniref:hypothetical protein n=1 Tax=Novosphingobium sp. TaxID=1874826 RepID=UPI0031CEAA5F
MALPPGRDASVAASIRVDLDNLGGEDLARSLRFLAVEGVRYALYAFATGASDLQADGLDIALEELVTPTAHARPAPHAGGNTADRARSDPAATTTARRLIADKGPSLDLPFSQPMQWDPEAERMLRGRWPLLDKRGGNALDCWSSGTALQMLDFGGLIADGNKGLIVDLAEAALLGTLEAAGCAIHLLTLDREDVDLLALDRAEGLCDFAIAAVPAQWQGAGRLETFCERMMQCLAKDGFLIMMINMTGDGEALAFRNRMQQLALYCIGLGHDVMQLAFPAGDSWHPPEGATSRFIWIARK